MKRVLALLLCVFMLFSMSLPVKAVEFGDLSDAAKEKFVTKLVDKISKELELVDTPRLKFYSCADWPVAASYYDGLNYIYVNLGVLNDKREAVRVVAHEIRHDYQYEHMNDDTDYGHAVYANKQNYIQYYDDYEAYFNQFTEKDAEEYAQGYVEKYFK